MKNTFNSVIVLYCIIELNLKITYYSSYLFIYCVPGASLGIHFM